MFWCRMEKSEDSKLEAEVRCGESVEPPEGSSEEEEEGDSDAPCVSPFELLAQGKKLLAAGDATAAIDSLQEVCSILAEEHGQVSRELAEPYYLYGIALLEVAREKSGVFGHGIPGEGSGDSGTGECSGGGGSGVCDGGDSGGGVGGCNGDGKPITSSPTPSCGSSNGGGEPIQPGPSSEAIAADTQGEEEESDLQLAWQVLELARIICQRESDMEYKLKLSDVNLALGEVGLECDQYEQAIIDLQSSLRLREFILEPSDRKIAEVHFNLGLAYTLAKQTEQAIEAYKDSKMTLGKRKEYLGEQLVAGTADSDVDNKDRQDELQELEELINDINSKIMDAKELKRVLDNQVSEDVECCSSFDKPSQDIAQGSESALKMKGPVSDISHLVRKRKPESKDVNDGETAIKRVHLESSSCTSSDPEAGTQLPDTRQQ